MSLKIAIVGAGPSGCLLARLLLQASSNNTDNNKISLTIYESESSPNFRSQGGTLDLHTHTGQAALKAAGLYGEFQKYARYDGEAMKIADKKLLCYITQGASKEGSITGRPEIDRPQLRELLYDSLPAGTVEWGCKLVRVDEEKRLHFANGRIAEGFDLIVGADGAWSRVRPVVSSVLPFYSGIAGHAFRVPDAETRHKELYDIVNRGSVFSFSDGKSIMAQYMSDGSLSVATWSVRPAEWQQAYDVRNPTLVKEACTRDYADWDPRLLAFTQVAEDISIAPRDLFMLPIGHSWPHVKGVTLIGDAAHLATPFAGEGVNLAFEDALKLSQAILSAVEHTSTAEHTSLAEALDTAIATFEQDMFRRATAMQQMTYDMMSAMYFTPGAPRNGIERYILHAISDSTGPYLIWLVAPIIWTYFFVFKLIW